MREASSLRAGSECAFGLTGKSWFSPVVDRYALAACFLNLPLDLRPQRVRLRGDDEQWRQGRHLVLYQDGEASGSRREASAT
jgi:hypothetical protein